MGIDQPGEQPRRRRSSREASTKVVENTLNWLKGNHSLSFGGSFTRVDLWVHEPDARPDGQLRPRDRRPGAGHVHDGQLPGRVATDLTNAQNLYALLTGRVTSIAREARIDASTDKYVILGESKAEGGCTTWASTPRTRGGSART